MFGWTLRVAAILLVAGCAGQASFDRQKAEVRRQLEFACVRDLMNQGHQLMYEAEAMTSYCRQVAVSRAR